MVVGGLAFLLVLVAAAAVGVSQVGYFVGYEAAAEKGSGLFGVLSRAVGAFPAVRNRFVVGSPLTAGGGALGGWGWAAIGGGVGWAVAGFALGALAWGVRCGERATRSPEAGERETGDVTLPLREKWDFAQGEKAAPGKRKPSRRERSSREVPDVVVG